MTLSGTAFEWKATRTNHFENRSASGPKKPATDIPTSGKFWSCLAAPGPLRHALVPTLVALHADAVTSGHGNSRAEQPASVVSAWIPEGSSPSQRLRIWRDIRSTIMTSSASLLLLYNLRPRYHESYPNYGQQSKYACVFSVPCSLCNLSASWQRHNCHLMPHMF